MTTKLELGQDCHEKRYNRESDQKEDTWNSHVRPILHGTIVFLRIQIVLRTSDHPCIDSRKRDAESVNTFPVMQREPAKR